MYSLKDKEGTIINNVREDFFKDYDCRKLIGNIDFSVAIPQTGKELFPDIEYLLWAEAKKGALSASAFHDAFIQLIFTIGRERTFDKNLPPKVLAKQIEKKVYLYGFLKGQAQVDPSERLTELQRENAELRHKLASQHSGEVHYHINHIDTLNIGDNVENKFS